MTDIASVLDNLLPGAIYYGSLTANTEEAYDALNWQDDRPKPTWEEIEAVEVKPPLAERLETIFISAIQGSDGVLTPEEEAGLFLIKTGITEMLKFNRFAAAQAMIEAAAIPEALEPVRAAMLAEFP